LLKHEANIGILSGYRFARECWGLWPQCAFFPKKFGGYEFITYFCSENKAYKLEK